MMKKIIITLSVLVFFTVLSVNMLFGQGSASSNLSAIKSKIIDVSIDKTNYKQSFEVIDQTKGKVNYTIVEVDEKGAAAKSEYIFYLSDIDKNTVIRKTSGKKLFVSISVNNKQKFVKLLKEGKLESYVDNVEILVADADAAQAIIDNLKTAIPLIKNSEKSFSSANDALSWLKNNIKDVDTKNGKVTQSFNFGSEKNYLVELISKSADSKGVTVEEMYNLNILDINKNNISVKVSGVYLSVSIEITGDNKYVKYLKNNQIQNYVNSFEILAEDVDQARGIISALIGAIEKSKSLTPDLGDITKASNFMKSKTADMIIDTKSTKQKLDITPGAVTKAQLRTEEADSKGKVTTADYEFYFADIEPASVNMKISGKKVLLVFNTVNKIKLIQYSKDNVLQNFVNEIELIYPDIETAREVALAIKKVNNDSKWQSKDWKNVADAMMFLENTVKGGTVGNKKYTISFDGDYTDPFKCMLNISVTDEKGITTEFGYLFYPQTFNPATVHLESSGKYLSVVSGIAGKKYWVKKVTKDNKNSFDSELEIMAFDSKDANEILDALKYIFTNAIPKEKVWSSGSDAVKFIKENVGDLSGSGKEVKQKLDMVENDPCKISFSITTIDSKGKNVEEIYEFSLSDINKLAVDFKTSSGNVYINLICKNKQKLIKVYKNGAQQDYASDLEIIDDDVDTAKNLVEAFKSAITKCEK